MVEAINNQEETRRQIGVSLQKYLEEIEELGIVSGVVVGSKEGEKKGYLWNIFTQDLRIEEAAQPPFEQLSQSVYAFHKSIDEFCPMRVSNVSPSNLEKLKEKCKEQSIDIEIISFDAEKTTVEEAVK